MPSSSTLLNLAGAIFILMPLGHTKMALDVLHPGLKALGEKSVVGYAARTSWHQANGYFVVSALLCFKWARENGSLPPGLERYVFATLLATHVATGARYAVKGVVGPPAVYWIASALMVGGVVL